VLFINGYKSHINISFLLFLFFFKSVLWAQIFVDKKSCSYLLVIYQQACISKNGYLRSGQTPLIMKI